MTYSINSGNSIPGVHSSWIRLKKRDNTDLTSTFTNIALNTWQIPLMSVTDYQTYQSLQGQALTSLETNDVDDRDAFVSYSSAILRLMSGRQDGINMRDVNFSFEVDITS